MKIVGIIFVTIGVLSLAKNFLDRISCKGVVNGTVIDIYKRVLISYNGTRKVTLYPVFKYNIDGNLYVKKSINGSKFCKFKIGQEVKVKYNLKNPDKYYVKGSSSKIMFSLIWLITGISMIALG